MFYFLLLMIAVTNLALGYAVATYFGFGPKPASELDAVFAQLPSNLPSFSIIGGDGDKTPFDELPPAQPLDAAGTEDRAEAAEPNAAELAASVPSEVAAFASLSEAQSSADQESNDEPNNG